VSMKETAHEIAEQAAMWATQIDAGSVDPDSDPDLRSWLNASPLHGGALLRAEGALSFIDRGRALAGVITKPLPRPIWIRRKLLIAGTALAAGLAGVLVMLPAPRHYDTGLGEIRQVPLPDGSLVAINTQSDIQIGMHPNTREVTLTKGEAWFKVAHDKSRPFVVSAGRIRIRAVGTAFSVRRHDDGVDVQVTEGTVETWTTGEEDRKTQIPVGTKAYVAEYQAPKPTAAPADIERSLAWREGQIVLEGETLDQAVAQFNRYNSKQLVITDQSLAQEKLVGQFRATEPGNFADAVATTLGADIKESGGTIQLSRGKPH
jgi:transmembrane sensor